MPEPSDGTRTALTPSAGTVTSSVPSSIVVPSASLKRTVTASVYSVAFGLATSTVDHGWPSLTQVIRFRTAPSASPLPPLPESSP